MNFRAFIAIIVCKALRLASRILHRGGTAMPGRYALRICPNLLSILARDVKSVVITGTNGKTTGARMIEEAFSHSGKSYFSNRSGANLISGITTEFAMNSTVFGKAKNEYAIIECDEAASVNVFAQMKPQVVVVTNLFRDQLDRFGDVTVTLENIRKAIECAPEAVLCLNADCSLTSSLAGSLPNRAVFFGLDKTACSGKKPETSDASHCIHCKTEYEYDYVSYGHLGGFRCPKCGYKRPGTDYAVTEILEQNSKGSTVIMNIRGQREIVKINLPAIYNVYNAAAAMAAVCEMGLGKKAAMDALAGFKCGFGRMEEFKLGESGARMMLVKNPAGCNQVIEFLQDVKEKFVLVVALNDHAGDGRDISWVWDADFEGLLELAGRLEKLIVSGDRAADMAVRIKYAGINQEHILIEKDYEKLVSWMEGQKMPIFIMPTYSAMLEMRQVIVKHCGGADFWE